MTLTERMLKAKIEQDEMLYLLQQFDPLLKKHARALYYEDAYNDLQLCFMELIVRVKVEGFIGKDEKYILSYIRKSIVSFSIKLSKQKMHHRVDKLQNDDFSQGDFYIGLLWCDLQNLLTKDEQQFLVDLYFEDISASELAKRGQVSKQAISNKKRRILDKIRTYYKEAS